MGQHLVDTILSQGNAKDPIDLYTDFIGKAFDPVGIAEAYVDHYFGTHATTETEP